MAGPERLAQSRGDSFPTSIPDIHTRTSDRLFTTSARACSAGRRSFFEHVSQAPQRTVQPPFSILDASARPGGCKEPSTQAESHLAAHRGRIRARTPPPPRHATAMRPLLHITRHCCQTQPLHQGRPADVELLGDIRPRAPAVVSPKHALPELSRVGSRHPARGSHHTRKRTLGLEQVGGQLCEGASLALGE